MVLLVKKGLEKGCKMASDKRFFVGGNWKMNGSKQVIDGIIQTLSESEVPADTGRINPRFLKRQTCRIRQLDSL